MSKFISPLSFLLLGMLPLCVSASEEGKLTVKSKQWISKRSLTQNAVDYYLDIYAVDNKKTEPNILFRSPGSFKNPKKSKHFVRSLSLKGKEGEDTIVEIPAGMHVYLSSYFVQSGGILNPGQIRHCNSIDYIFTENVEYVLDVNFISKGPVSGECSTAIYTPEQYEQSYSNIREKTSIEGLSRKELSLLYGNRRTARLTAAEISQGNDYLAVYIDAAVDRLYEESKGGDKKNSLVAWLSRIISESGSSAHISAMVKISDETTNKFAKKKIKKYVPKKFVADKAYMPKPISSLKGYKLDDLTKLVASENLKSMSKFEIEAAARDIVDEPTDYKAEVFALAAEKLSSLKGTTDREMHATSIWLIRVLQASGKGEYISLLSEVEAMATHKKVRGAATKAIEQLSLTDA